MNLKNRLTQIEKRHKHKPNIIVIFPTDKPDQAASKQAAAAADQTSVIIRVKQDR